MSVENVIRNPHPLKVSQYSVISVAFGHMPLVKVYISQEQLRLFSLSNFVYYCQINDCANRMKNITVDWIQSHDTSKIESTVSDLTKEHLTTEHSTIQKAVNDLSAKIDKLQA